MGNIKSIRFEYISLPTDIGHIQFDHPVQTLVAVLGAFELNERAPHSPFQLEGHVFSRHSAAVFSPSISSCLVETTRTVL